MKNLSKICRFSSIFGFVLFVSFAQGEERLSSSPQPNMRPQFYRWKKPANKNFIQNIFSKLSSPALKANFDKARSLKTGKEWVSRGAQYVGSARIADTWQQVIRSEKGDVLFSTGSLLPKLPDGLVSEVSKMESRKEDVLLRLKQLIPSYAGSSWTSAPKIEIYWNEPLKEYEPRWVISYVNEFETAAWKAYLNSKLELIKHEEVGIHFVDGQAVVYPSGPKLSPLTPVTLFSLLGDGSLSSQMIRVTSALNPEAWSQSLDFKYGINDTRFDEVQAYFYADKAIRWFKQNLNIDMTSPISIKVNVGQNNKSNAAFYFQRKIFLGSGDGELYQDMLKDPSIVMHETSHALIEEIAGLPSQGEGGAINEGFADFFTACILDNPNIGEVSYLKGHYRRTLLNNLKAYKDFSDGVYNNGNIISGTFWDIRRVFGIEKTALLAIRTLSRLGEGGKFDDFGPAVLLAAENKQDFGDGLGFEASVRNILIDRGWKVGAALTSQQD